MDVMLWGVVIFLAAGVYFLPALTAHERKHANFSAILVLNLLLGWTLLGWAVALVWSYTGKKAEAAPTAEAVQRCPKCGTRLHVEDERCPQCFPMANPLKAWPSEEAVKRPGTWVA